MLKALRDAGKLLIFVHRMTQVVRALHAKLFCSLVYCLDLAQRLLETHLTGFLAEHERPTPHDLTALAAVVYALLGVIRPLSDRFSRNAKLALDLLRSHHSSHFLPPTSPNSLSAFFVDGEIA